MANANGAPVLAPEMVDNLWQKASELQDSMVDFARRLVQRPSLSGQEG